MQLWPSLSDPLLGIGGGCWPVECWKHTTLAQLGMGNPPLVMLLYALKLSLLWPWIIGQRLMSGSEVWISSVPMKNVNQFINDGLN